MTPTPSPLSWWVKTVRSGARAADGSLPAEVWTEGVVCPTLNAHDNGGESRATVIAFGHTQGLDIQPSTEATPTLRKNGNGAAIAANNVRRLTPLECERLQGFPDDWTAGQADSHRYKQMGNAVTVNVANYVGSLIMHSLSPGTADV